MNKLLLGQYEVLAPLGDGSNGITFKVRHHDQGYIRAIKQLKGYIESKDSDKYRSFLEEYRKLTFLGNCSHPNIVNVHKADMVDNTAFYEMDYIDGVTLTQYIANEKVLPIDEVLRCSRDLLSAMAYAHVDIYKYMMNREVDDLETDPKDPKKVIYDEAKERQLIEKYGIIHNDLHSSNLMRNNYDGRYILLDFGISMQGGKAVRKSGLGEGALAYMAPEKILMKEVSFRSDVYSIGVMLYEILTGKVPFSAEDENKKEKSSAIMFKIHTETPVPDMSISRAKAHIAAGHTGNYERDFPEWMENIILKCLAKKPEERYANAKEVYDEFISHMKTSLTDFNEYKKKAVLFDDMKRKVENMQEQMHDYDEQKRLAGLYAEQKSKLEEMRTIVSDRDVVIEGLKAQMLDYNEQKRQAGLFAEQKSKTDMLESDVAKRDSIIGDLKAQNHRLKIALSSNVKRGFVWTLVVVLAIAVAVIYAPIIAA